MESKPTIMAGSITSQNSSSVAGVGSATNFPSPCVGDDGVHVIQGGAPLAPEHRLLEPGTGGQHSLHPKEETFEAQVIIPSRGDGTLLPSADPELGLGPSEGDAPPLGNAPSKHSDPLNCGFGS